MSYTKSWGFLWTNPNSCDGNVEHYRGYRPRNRAFMKVGRVYKAQYNVYDITDINAYLVVIKSESKADHPNLGYYYEAEMLDTGYKFHFYPKDWSVVHELSSLELELL